MQYIMRNFRIGKKITDEAGLDLQGELEERLSALKFYSIEEEIRVEGDLPTFLKIALKNEV